MLEIDGVEVLGVGEAAAYVGRTPETVRRWVWSGRITARRQGNRLLLSRSDLDRLADPLKVEPLDLESWSLLLPNGDGASAADLVLQDRVDRSAARAGH